MSIDKFIDFCEMHSDEQFVEKLRQKKFDFDKGDLILSSIKDKNVILAKQLLTSIQCDPSKLRMKNGTLITTYAIQTYQYDMFKMMWEVEQELCGDSNQVIYHTYFDCDGYDHVLDCHWTTSQIYHASEAFTMFAELKKWSQQDIVDFENLVKIIEFICEKDKKFLQQSKNSSDYSIDYAMQHKFEKFTIPYSEYKQIVSLIDRIDKAIKLVFE